MGKLLKVYKNFSGGLSEVANDNMADNELVEAQNAEPSSTYGIQRCGGVGTGDGEYVRMRALGDWPIRYIIPFTARINNVDVNQVIIFAEVESSLGGGYVVYYKDITEATWHTLEDNNNHVPAMKGWFSYANILYFLTGTKIYRWDGTTAMQMTEAQANIDSGKTLTEGLWTTIEKASAVGRRGERWFFAVGQNEVWYSDRGLPTYIVGAVNAISQDTDYITALHEFNNTLLIFKRNSVYQLSGWDFTGNTDLTMTRLNVVSGTSYPDTIVTSENSVLFLGNDGIYKLYIPYYSSVTATQNISNKKISKRLMINNGRPVRACATVWHSVYYIALEFDKTTSDNYPLREEYRYYIDDKSYWGPFTQGACCYVQHLFDDLHLYFGTSGGFILRYQDDSYSYMNLKTAVPMPIPMVVKTKAYDVVGTVFTNAKVKRALIAAKQFAKEDSKLYIQIKADYADEAYNYAQEDIEQMVADGLGTNFVSFDESLVYGDGRWFEERWGWVDTVCKQFPIGRKTKHFQFILKSNEEQPLVIYALGLLYKRKKVKGNAEGVERTEIVE